MLVKLMVFKININIKRDKRNCFLVHQIDSTRMDLVIPGEQHLYLRAATSQERQQWLVALGTAKACVYSTKQNDLGNK